MPSTRYICVFVIFVALSGCALKNNETFDTSKMNAFSNSPKVASSEGQQLIDQSYKAANTLAKILRQYDVPGNQTIALSSFVNVDDMERTSTLGRLLPEQISSRLSQLGFVTAELKERGSAIFIRNRDGEFSLSRNLPSVLKSEGFTSVLAGTYAVEPDTVYVNVRVVRVSDQAVLAGADFALRATPGIRAMSTTSVNSDAPLRPSVDTGFGNEKATTSTRSYTVRTLDGDE